MQRGIKAGTDIISNFREISETLNMVANILSTMSERLDRVENALVMLIDKKEG